MLEDLEINVKLKINQSPFPRSLDKYDRKRILGTGGFSKVYEAICRSNGYTVAIKIIEKSVINKGSRDRILQEISIQSQLNHSAILKLFTAFEDSNYVCLVLEFCSEGDLVKYIDKKGISRKDVNVLMKQIVDGLEYLHSKFILHRDIKLANILLTDDQRVKIADFGLATRMSYPGEPHMTMCGTPNYISPEIVTHKVHGLEADLWSLGCLLYTLLVGKPPFETDSPFNTMDRVTAGNYFMPPFLPETAQDLINRLLQKNPSFRITLDEVRNHPFLSESLISVDSGVDTYLGSSNVLSNKYNSLDRKQTYSNFSNGYGSFETPKSSRRCKSQDRQNNREPSLVSSYNKKPLYADMVFFPDNKYQNMQLESDRLPYSLRSENHRPCQGTTDFSPGRLHNLDSGVKQKCEMFCENEILNHKDCDCWRCKIGVEKDSPKKIISTKRQLGIRGGCTSDSDGIEETIKVIPFDTNRLDATRTELKNVVLSILDNGDVCVERLKQSKDKKVVVEVVRVSRNGLKMQIYYPNKGCGVPLGNYPPPLPLSGADAVFNCTTLSKENWKKYQRAAQYVELVKSKTPKITLYTTKAKCLLMENVPEPDFQIIYYDGTSKITKSRKAVVLENHGKEWKLPTSEWSSNSLDRDLQDHYNYFQECYHRCCSIETQLSKLSLSNSREEFKVFPAILGKKQTCRSDVASWNSCMESPDIVHSTKYMT